MSNSEFKARALYEFAAEGPNELSFNANDILTITSNTAGHGWWYAKSASGKVGVIPQNYVEALSDLPEPNEPPPPPLSSFSNPANVYFNRDLTNTNFNTSKTSIPTFDPPQYMNPTTYSNWQSQDPPAWSPPITAQSNQVAEQTLTNSSQPLKICTESEKKLANNVFISDDTDNGYITVTDLSPRLILMSNTYSKSPELTNLSDDIYEYLETPRPMPSMSNHISPFYFPNISLPLPQQSTISNNYLIPVSSSEELHIYNTIDDVGISHSQILHNKSKTMSLPMRPLSRRDTDSDDSFSDSECPPSSQQATNSNTLSKQNLFKNTATLTPHSTSPYPNSRSSFTGGEVNKPPPRARFFDKHGLDNYLLNGSKAKPEEHVEIAYDENDGGVCWARNLTLPPFNCRVEEPSKGTKLGGLKAFTEYKVITDIPGSHFVLRRYKQFDWLHEQLVNKFRFICIPPLPEKQIAGRFDQEFVEERRRQLELWLNRVCRHPVLCASYAVQHFIACDANDKNKKDWKGGKRKVEKDELREASWLQCVTLTNTGLSESQIAAQIETFAQQQPGLESHLKSLNQGLIKYLERQTEVYERDILRVSDLFSKVYGAVHVDTTTAGNKELSSSISKISGSYGEIADLYKTKATADLRDFIERIQEYIGLLACFPSILSIQKSASEFIKTLQQRAASSDFTNAIHRGLVLNHVVLAEVNFFQKEKVTDFKVYMKGLVDKQTEFYEKVSTSLRDASLSFK
ncbi:unnamed protein product [Rotaria socialis]|uniref:Sorting nexin n=1 Tax=Rotaria socialis TaxID=392032 RepID=A0A818A988_9BILA|nr:unnamed protein product [Rotaria socialis]